MGREVYLADLYRQSVQTLTQNRKEWMGLLSSVSKYYKLSFDKNVLIYVQRPDAGLIATKAGWEKQTGRYLKAGAKGIGVVDMSHPKASLAYYFDLADTRGDDEGFRKAISALWSLEKQYQPELLKRFHQQFGTDEEQVENCLCQLIGKEADAFLGTYLSRVEVRDENSLLYGLPVEAVREEFARLVVDSAAYMVFQKCGIKTELFSETDSFAHISHFGSLELFMALGFFACAIARPVLSGIHRQIEEIKEERSLANEKRTFSETGIPDRGGRDALSETSAIKETGIRPDAGGHLRKELEGVHEGEPSHEAGGTDRPGEDQRGDHPGGSGRGGKERSADSKTSGSPAPAGDGRDAETGRTYGDADQTGRGDHPAGSDLSGAVKEQEANLAEQKEREKESREEPQKGSSLLPSGLEDTRESFFQKEQKAIRDLLRDVEVYPLNLYERIAKAFHDYPESAKRREEVKAIYLDHGEQKSPDGMRGIVPMDKAITFFYGEEIFVHLSWDEVTEKIRDLMEGGEYFSYREEEGAVDFAIPEEEEERQRSEKEEKENGQLSLFTLYPVPDEKTDGGAQVLGEGKEGKSQEAKKQTDGLSHSVKAEQRKVGEPFREREKGAGEEPVNYRYQPEHQLYEGGPKAKFRHNLEAIRLWKELEQENRIPGPQEQILLARFVGWGGLADALTYGKEGWEKEYAQIEELLTPEEMQEARASTLTSYYTDQKIVQCIYGALWQFGFRWGNILDPAMGTGNFFSALPEKMGESKLYGVELDPIAGGIARKLYPQAQILVKGFEDTQFSDSFFDVVVGNVPFHNIRVSDRRYDRFRFKIHEYFLAKSLDKLRAGGILAVITSKFTLDKRNPSVRKYLASRAELIGAIRLPENAFKQVAGTEATTDILFLKKRQEEILPDEQTTPWLGVEKNEQGIPCNSYFLDHPEMVLGTLVQETGMYGSQDFVTCKPYPDRDLEELLKEAISHLHGQYEEPQTSLGEDKDIQEEQWIPATPKVKNYSYTKKKGMLYYREDSRMYRQETGGKRAERIMGLIDIREALRELMEFQLHGDPDTGLTLSGPEYESRFKTLLNTLNQKYDTYVKAYGYLNQPGNVMAFSKDADAALLRSIEQEVRDAQGRKVKGEYEKTAVFFKATIRPKRIPQSADTLEEALKITLNSRGKFDLAHIQYLYRKEGGICSKEEILEQLGERVYQDPKKWQEGDPYSGWMMAEEYLSGQVKEKLAQAMVAADAHPEVFLRNVKALKQVQPKPLTPEEISFVLGSTWIPVEVYEQFMHEKFGTRDSFRGSAVHLEFAECSGTYFITEKGLGRDLVTATKTYGTERMNAYEILEYTLNLKTVEVRDRQEYTDPETGEEKIRYVLNKQETLLAREKQARIKQEFESWLFAESERGAKLTALYNYRFNNIRPRTYNGEDLLLPDMSEAITLRKHQKDAIAMGIYGDGNLLVAHEVGAGKTMTACAIAYERKRLGICHKPLIAVPNHTLEQWAAEFMRLYPGANLLVATKKDFEKSRRRRFVSRIATGDYDCILMGHSSFELIALSRERQLAAMKEEIDELTDKINEMKRMSGQSWSLKQMEVFRHNLQDRFDRLYNEAKKDNTISFEELGVDNLFVDEAHAYKNNYSYTKMQRVAGVGGQSSQRAMDMYMKCQYINEITREHGIVYLTGTPVANSMAELYVIQKTLQPSQLKQRGVFLFDSWASTFGRVETSLEIRPEGSGYQMKSRFAKFHNLPELMSMLFLVADIKTSDMLNLPVPRLKTGKMQVIKTKITPDQKRIMEKLVERAEAIRNREVDSSEDNFLRLTGEARLLSVDPRILEETLENDPDTKLNICAREVAEIYHETKDRRFTQIIFCDKGTPKADGSFTFYQAMRQELVRLGVEEKEVVFIHEANTDSKRAQLFEQVRKGEVRILMGSTEKMGTGLNVQDKLIALHNLDAPWRPADLTQRNGRILRQGNENEEVSIINYITEQTFDAYLWQILEQKQRYISQIMTGRSALRSCEDVDEVVLQYAEFKALAVSDPKIKRKMEVDNEIYRLQTLKSAWKAGHSELQEKLDRIYPRQIKQCLNKIQAYEQDVKQYGEQKPEEFTITLNHRLFEERTKAGEYLALQMGALGQETGDTLVAGTYAGFSLLLKRGAFQGVLLCLQGEGTYQTDTGESALGNITRVENLAKSLVHYLDNERENLQELKEQMEAAKQEVGKPFLEEEKLAELLKEQVSLNLALEFREEEEKPEGEQSGRREKGIYRKLKGLAPELFSGTYTYLHFKRECFDDLVIEKIGEQEYSIAHYYEQNGDLMRDPEITFRIDEKEGAIWALSYTQDNLGIYYETKDRSQKQVEELLGFFDQWLINIENQGFVLHAAYGETKTNSMEIQRGEEEQER